MVSSLASCLMCLHVVIRGRRSSINDILLFSSWGVFPKIHMEMEREVQGELVAPESPAGGQLFISLFRVHNVSMSEARMKHMIDRFREHIDKKKIIWC